MSFKRIDNFDTKYAERSFTIIYNFNDKDASVMKNILNLLGVKDICVLNKNNGDSKLKDIIDNNINNESTTSVNEGAVIFNNIPHTVISGFSTNLSKFKVRRPLMAMITEGNIDWSLNNLVYNLTKERDAIKSGNTINH